MEILSFDEALKLAGEKRHLMLGNGFSIALRPDIFRYGSLFEKADFSDYPEVGSTFAALGSEDFEEAVQALEGAAKILPGFIQEAQGTCERMTTCAAKIKDVLVQTIAGQHPSRPRDIEDHQYAACLNFLQKFLTGPKPGKVYTLNYDILLYWVLMQGLDRKVLNFDDGFRTDEDNPDAEYVVWGDPTHSQNVYYLHGALHLFDGGHELQKYTWIRTDLPLIEQTREAIRNNFFPLFVAEGTSEKKMRKICHHAYLSKGQRSLAGIKDSLFLHGLSLAENDAHILQVVQKNIGLNKIFVSIYGAPDAAENQKIMRVAQAMGTSRKSKHPLAIHFYDSVSAKVWGD